MNTNTNTPTCKGTNCTAVAGVGHSPECEAEHNATAHEGAGNRWPEDRYDGYKGRPCRDGATDDQRAAWDEGRPAASPADAAPQDERACGNEECGWTGQTDRMCGTIGPLCPDCGETTERAALPAQAVPPVLLQFLRIGDKYQLIGEVPASLEGLSLTETQLEAFARAALAAPVQDVAPTDARPLPWPWESAEQVLLDAIDHIDGQDRLKDALRILAAQPAGQPADAPPLTGDRLIQSLIDANKSADAQDAARYRWLRDLQCNSVSVGRNEGHASNYMTAKRWIEEAQPEDFEHEDPAELQRMKDTDTIWRLQVYPKGPTTFDYWQAATLDAAIDAARTQGGAA